MKQFYLAFFISLSFLLVNFTNRNAYNATDDQTRTVQVYPNPATSVINFEFTSEFNKSSTPTLSIFSFFGKKMNDVSITTNKITLNLDGYYRGLYVFQIHDKFGNIIESGKFQVIK